MIPAPEPERPAAKRAQLSMTPMIDCVFLLLIFFMVGTKFREQDRQVQANLPVDGERITPSEPLGEIWIFI